MRHVLPLLALTLFACEDEPTPVPTGPPAPEQGPLTFDPATPVSGDVGDQWSFDVAGVLPDSAYRITLVHADNVTVAADGTGTFVDSGTGTANAGPSETVAGIYHVHYNPFGTPVKTYPDGSDDPAMPSGVLPLDGDQTIGFGVEGLGEGTVYPVFYRNGGESTFLEIDENGTPTEPYVIGPAISVNAPPTPPPPTPVMAFDPDTPQTIAPAETYDYTITGLDDTAYYRITLVIGANVTAAGGSGVFVDGGAGTADAGNSQDYALITSVAGSPVDPGAKTVPSPDDDPTAPTGIQPTGGQIALTVTGVADGTVYPVVYVNGGTSTFLEIDGTGAPTEDYVVGGSITVATP
jgi:hypothetical protein